MCWCFRPPWKGSEGVVGGIPGSLETSLREILHIFYFVINKVYAESSFQGEISHSPQNYGLPLEWKWQGKRPWCFPLPDSLCIPGDNNCFWGCLQSLNACWACHGLRVAWRTSRILQRPCSPTPGTVHLQCPWGIVYVSVLAGQSLRFYLASAYLWPSCLSQNLVTFQSGSHPKGFVLFLKMYSNIFIKIKEF